MYTQNIRNLYFNKADDVKIGQSLEGRAAFGHVGTRRRTLSKRAVVVGIASPPCHGVDVIVVEGEESEHGHEGRPGIQTG